MPVDSQTPPLPPSASPAAELATKIALENSKRESCFRRLQILYDLSLIVLDDSIKEFEFESRLRDLDKTRDSYQTSVFELAKLNLQLRPDLPCPSTDIENVDALYYSIMAIKEQLRNRKQTDDAIKKNSFESEELLSTSKPRPRLPKMDLYVFDGDLLNWTTFHDIFFSLVHSNPAISDVEKFFYLMSATKGPALSLVRSLPITSNNYSVIWESLKAKYENKRALASNYLDKMFQFPRLYKESAADLEFFLQTFRESVNALKALQIPDCGEFMLFYLAQRNLDPSTRKIFEQQRDRHEIPTFDQLMNFVQDQIHVLEMASVGQPGAAKPNISKKSEEMKHASKIMSNKSKQGFTSSLVSSSEVEPEVNRYSCPCCKLNHSIYRCFHFLALTPNQRKEKIVELQLCENCLKSHGSAQCTSTYCCSLCSQRHHTLLHTSGASDAVVTSRTEDTAGSSLAACHSSSAPMTTAHTVLLGTALIHVRDRFNNYQTVRAIIDNAAQGSFITSVCAQRLHLPQRTCNVSTSGLGTKSVSNQGVLSCTFKPCFAPGPMVTTDMVILPYITHDMPSIILPTRLHDEYKHLSLADPNFTVTSGVDILLGGDVYNKIMKDQVYRPENSDMPHAYDSIFGFIILGCLAMNSAASQTNVLLAISNEKKLEETLKAFWEIENVPEDTLLSPEDKYCEETYAKLHYREETGRYVVPLLLKPESADLGESYTNAFKRFQHIEKRLSKDTNLYSAYRKFMQEYENLGHMKECKPGDTETTRYVIPHHCVVKPSSSTTKHRVVFDASFKTKTDLSLNDVLYTGPKLQNDIAQVLLGFRLNAVAFTADISKMYRQILIRPEERGYQHILWRTSPDEPIKEYELQTITYGLASSPYLAIRTIHQLAADVSKMYPDIAFVLLQGVYVDDLLWSTSTLEKAVTIRNDLNKVLATSGLEFRKWTSNTPDFLTDIPMKHQETLISFHEDKNPAIKVLGLQWIPSEDCFSFNISTTDSVFTKRSILSQIARLFDPLGLVAPCIFLAKYFMQKLWKLSLDWDETLPPNLQQEWFKFISELPLLSQVRCPRYVSTSHAVLLQLVGFCDASACGYAAVVYLRALNEEGEAKSTILLSKSRVSPLQTITIPRPLETAEQNVRRLSSKADIVLPYPDSCHLDLDSITTCERCGAIYCCSGCKESAVTTYHRLLCFSNEDTNHPLAQLMETWKQIHYPPETTNIMLLVRVLAYIEQHPDPSAAAARVKQFCHRTVNEDAELVHKLLGEKFSDQLCTLREMTANAIHGDHIQEFLTPDGFCSLMALIGTNGQGIGTSPLAMWVNAVSDLTMSDDERKQLDLFIDKLYEYVEEESGSFLNTEGSGLYALQSACNHSCVPNAEPTFPHGNHRVTLRATRDIQPGDEVFISYLDDCSLGRSRHSRQKELALNYLFICSCEKCQSEAAEPDITSAEEMSEDDELQDMDD